MISCVKFKLGRGVVIIFVFKRLLWRQSGEFMGMRVTLLLLEIGNTGPHKAEVGSLLSVRLLNLFSVTYALPQITT